MARRGYGCREGTMAAGAEARASETDGAQLTRMVCTPTVPTAKPLLHAGMHITRATRSLASQEAHHEMGGGRQGRAQLR